MTEVIYCDACGAEDCTVAEFSVEERDGAALEVLVAVCACCGDRSELVVPAAA
jgi:hypothetical protein